jgi:hypothetical protein
VSRLRDLIASRRGHAATTLARATLAAGATACIALALGAADARPEARLQLVDGTLSMSNSRDGAAIFSANNMRPGQPATGTVTIANTGSVSGDFSLSSFGVTDVPGRGGGLLSTALSATVSDVTDGASPRQVYAGPLGSMPKRPLGALGPGEQRTYSFTVALPLLAANLNDVQGGSVTIGYRWESVTAGDEEPPPPTTPVTPPPPGTGPGTGTGPAPPPPTGGGNPGPPADPRPFSLRVTGPSRWSVRARSGPSITARCTRPCILRASVRLRGVRGKLPLKVRSKPAASRGGRAMRFSVVPSRRAVTTLRRLLARHRRVSIAIKVTGTDVERITATVRKLIRVRP